jgi:hypothetical protein
MQHHPAGDGDLDARLVAGLEPSCAARSSAVVAVTS